MIEKVDEQDYLEVLAKLEDKHIADVLENSEEWKLIYKATKQMRDLAQEQYNHLDHTKAESKYQAIQLQVAIQFYDDFFKSILEKYKALGDEAYEQAKERGWMGGIARFIKSSF